LNHESQFTNHAVLATDGLRLIASLAGLVLPPFFALTRPLDRGAQSLPHGSPWLESAQGRKRRFRIRTRFARNDYGALAVLEMSCSKRAFDNPVIRGRLETVFKGIEHCRTIVPELTRYALDGAVDAHPSPRPARALWLPLFLKPPSYGHDLARNLVNGEVIIMLDGDRVEEVFGTAGRLRKETVK
jgi:hypothetical protein